MTQSLKIPEIFNAVQPPFDRTNIDLYRKLWDEKKTTENKAVDLFAGLTTLLEAWQTSHEAPRTKLPRKLMENYPFLFHELTDRMPTIEFVDQEQVVAALKLFNVAAPDSDLIDTVVMDWLGYLAFNAVKILLERCIKIKKDPTFNMDGFLALIEPYWAAPDRDLAELLIANVTLIAWERAIPLLDRIAEQPDQDEDIKAFALRYKNWVMAEMMDQKRS